MEESRFEQTIIMHDYVHDETEKQNEDQLLKTAILTGQQTRMQDAAVKTANERTAFLDSRHYRFLRYVDDMALSLSETVSLGKKKVSELVSPVQRGYRSIKSRIHETEWYQAYQEKEERKFQERLAERQAEDPLALFEQEKGIDLQVLVTERAFTQDKSKKEQPLSQLDQTVTKEQREAVEQADRWLLQRAVRKGAPLAFVRRVLASSLREKLMLYHQIETGRLDSAGSSDILVSQTGYTPDLSIIKKRLTGSHFHLWNKLRHRGATKIHWEKLDGAFEQVRSPASRQEIEAFSHLDQLKQQTGVDLTPAYEAAAKCQRAIERRDNGIFFMKRVRNEEVQEAAQEAYQAVNRLYGNVIQKYFSEKQKSLYKDSDTLSNLMKFSFNQVAAVGGKISQIPMLYQDAMTEAAKKAYVTGTNATLAGMDVQNMMTGLNITAGAFTTMTGVMALISTLKGLPKAIEALKNGDMDWGSDLSMVLGMSKGFLAGGFAASAGITTMIYAPAIGMKSAGTLSTASKWNASIDQMKLGTKIVGATISAASLAVDGVSAGIQVKNFIHHHAGSKEVKRLKERGALQGVDADYADGIIRLDRRNKTKKAVETTASAIANATTLTTTLIGAPLGMLIGVGINVTAQVASKITTKILSHYSIKSTVDEFLKIKDIKDIRALIKDRDGADNITDKELEKLREPLRERMAAELGYSSYKTLYRHVVQKYAGFLYSKLFFHMEAGKMVPYTQDTAPSNMPELDAYKEVVKGLGLRVKYPTDIRGTDRHPSAMMIAGKLMG